MANPIIPGLNQEQTDVYYSWENMLRAIAGEQARVNNRWNTLATTYAAQIQAIFVLMTPNTNQIVPNTSGLAGSQSLNVGAESVIIMDQGQGILTNYNTAAIRQLWTKAAGAANMIG